jgi:hypothetical protein
VVFLGGISFWVSAKMECFVYKLFLIYVILCLIDIGLCISYFNIGILNLNIHLRDLYI